MLYSQPFFHYFDKVTLYIKQERCIPPKPLLSKAKHLPINTKYCFWDVKKSENQCKNKTIIGILITGIGSSFE